LRSAAWRGIWTVFRYEFRSLGRDRKSLVFFFLVPVFLYPLGFSLLRWASRKAEFPAGEAPLKIGIQANAPELRELFLADDRFEVKETDHPREETKAGDVDAGLERKGKDPLELALYFDASRPSSLKAHDRALRILHGFRWSRAKEMLDGQDSPLGSKEWFRIELSDVTHPDKTARRLMADWISLAMVVLVLATAGFASLDLFPGQRERGVTETLLVHPIAPLCLVLGKWTVCLAFSYLGTALNLSSLLVCAALGLFPGKAQPLLLPASRIAWTFLLLLPFCVLVNSILVWAASRARTFRAGQGIILPACLLMLVPLYAARLPGVTLNAFFSLVPVTNVALALKAAFLHEIPGLPLWLTFLSNALFSFLFLLAASKSLAVEPFLAAPEDASFEGGIRSYAEGAFLFAGGIILLHYFVGSWMQSRNLVLGLALTFYGLLLLPGILYAKRRGLRLKDALRLRWPGLLDLLLAVGLSFPLASLVHALLKLQNLFLPMPGELEEAFRKLVLLGNLSGGWRLFLLAVSPGLCEEFFFRGVLLSELRRAQGPWRAVGWTSLLFGAAHLSVFRLFPTVAVGFYLGTIALKGRSLLPAMACHISFNALLLFFPEWPSTAASRPPSLGLCFLGSVLGIAWFWRRSSP